jgi:hypothetical protein
VYLYGDVLRLAWETQTKVMRSFTHVSRMACLQLNFWTSESKQKHATTDKSKLLYIYTHWQTHAQETETGCRRLRRRRRVCRKELVSFLLINFHQVQSFSLRSAVGRCGRESSFVRLLVLAVPDAWLKRVIQRVHSAIVIFFSRLQQCLVAEYWM